MLHQSEWTAFLDYFSTNTDNHKRALCCPDDLYVPSRVLSQCLSAHLIKGSFTTSLGATCADAVTQRVQTFQTRSLALEVMIFKCHTSLVKAALQLTY